MGFNKFHSIRCLYGFKNSMEYTGFENDFVYINSMWMHPKFINKCKYILSQLHAPNKNIISDFIINLYGVNNFITISINEFTIDKSNSIYRFPKMVTKKCIRIAYISDNIDAIYQVEVNRKKFNQQLRSEDVDNIYDEISYRLHKKYNQMYKILISDKFNSDYVYNI